jgi:hypothetical protein
MDDWKSSSAHTHTHTHKLIRRGVDIFAKQRRGFYIKSGNHWGM